jgi:Zn-dependent M28 family amino/carboxypeptidase
MTHRPVATRRAGRLIALTTALSLPALAVVSAPAAATDAGPAGGGGPRIGIELDAGTEVVLLGAHQDVTATVTNPGGRPFRNRDVEFTVLGEDGAVVGDTVARPTSGSDRTDREGEATFTFQGLVPATVVVEACVTFPPGRETCAELPLTVSTDPLTAAVTEEALFSTLEDFAAIDAEFGERFPGPGYQASVDYIVEQVEALGLEAQLQDFDFLLFQDLTPPELEVVAPPESARTFVADEDFATLVYSGRGEVTAPVTLVESDLGPDQPGTGEPNDGGSDAGCSTEGGVPDGPAKDDFAEFPAGTIALIQRGSCTFFEKTSNAFAAGAAGVIIFNEGNNADRSGVLFGTLGAEVDATLPSVGTSFEVGLLLAQLSQVEGAQVRLRTDSSTTIETTQNVLVDYPGGDPDNTVILGAHLDSVQDSAGINDNASGSATVLEVLRQLVAADVKPDNRLRFAWWGAEELGLFGSEAYVFGDAAVGGDTPGLTEEELAQIRLYLNFDSLASINFGRFVLADPLGAGLPEGTEGAATVFDEYFERVGLYSERTDASSGSDQVNFALAGIPVSGVSSYDGGVKSEEQAQPDRFGGVANESFDECLNSPCDDLFDEAGELRVSPEVLTQLTRATADATLRFAFNLDVLQPQD